MPHLKLTKNLQSGASLIEIMLSLAIGLVVVGAVLVSYLGSGQTGKFQNAYSQMNEDAQLALNILSREIQMAGYVNPTSVVVATQTLSGSYTDQAIGGCDTGFTAAAPIAVVPTAWNATTGAPTATNAAAVNRACAVAGNVALELGYEADTQNTVASAGGFPTDCLGNSLQFVLVTPTAVFPPFYPVRNRYYIANNAASGLPELYCRSNAVTAAGVSIAGQPIIENVQSMRVWYGMTGDESAVAPPRPRRIVRYVNAATVAGNWDRVVAVRVCLVLRSSERVVSSDEATSYRDCDNVVTNIADGFLRRSYFTTASIRSRMAL